MKKLMLVLVVVAFATMSFGCNGTDNGPSNAGLPIPDWFLNPPMEPGMAIFGTGTFTMDSIDELQLGRTAAAAAARREIAESMKVKLQGVLKNYAKKIVTAEKKTKYEQLTQDVMRQIVDNTIHGAVIQQQDIKPYEGKLLVFVLVRIGFDGVAKGLSDATRKEFEEVEENAAEAFAEMDELLKAQSQKPYVTDSAKSYAKAPTPE
ncbi:MAG: hypothetical protein K8S87_03695 [Planctomycetes bacterium]|nr:hypothetical protein [Planctomycetota bacterium]